MAQSASLHVPVCGGHTEGAKNTHRSAEGQEVAISDSMALTVSDTAT